MCLYRCYCIAECNVNVQSFNQWNFLSLFQFSSIAYFLVYVDDMVLTGNCPQFLHSFFQQLNNSFSLKELGDLDYFLGIEVKSQPSGALLLTQRKYIRDLLLKTAMHEAKPIATPMSSSSKFSKTGSPHFSDPSFFISVVGALQYATITRPDLSYSVNRGCQFMAHPLDSHWHAVKRILHYLQGTIQLGLQLSPAKTRQPRLFMDYVMQTGMLI